MSRTVLSKEKLLHWMNLQLAKYEECDNCKFNSVVELKEVDENGCNWSSSNLNCSGVPAQVCHPIAQQIITQAKIKLNVNSSKKV